MWLILRRILLVAVALVAAAAGGWYVYGRSCRNEYEARIDALRAAGQPTRFKDLAAPPIPDGENAAKLLDIADHLLEERIRTSSDTNGLLYKNELTDEERAAVAAYLESLAPYFDMLARVPRLPGWWLDSERIRRGDIFRPIDRARQYISWRAQFDSQETGRTERAANAVVLLLDLSDKCRVPCVLGCVVVAGTLTELEPARILRTAMRQPGFDVTLFRKIVDDRLRQAIRGRGPPKSSIVEERVLGIDSLAAIRDGDTSNYFFGDPAHVKPISFFRTPSFYRDAGRFLDLVDYVIAHSDATPEESLLAVAELRRRFGAKDPPDTLPGDQAAFWARVLESHPKQVAGARLLRVVMALLEYRQRERVWPESLAALDEMPTDPYSGGSFRYEHTDHGCRIRSSKEGTPEDLEERFLAWPLEDDQIPAMPR